MQEVALEELFAQTEELLKQLEAPQISLEDAFAAYEKGMKLIRACNERIDRVEKKMLMISEDGGLQAFDEEGNCEDTKQL